MLKSGFESMLLRRWQAAILKIQHLRFVCV
jgi:hypothetical protein